MEPACFLYTSEEIPGPYPQYPKGWGGANASGYSNLQFDLACRQALNSLPDAARTQPGPPASPGALCRRSAELAALPDP